MFVRRYILMLEMAAYTFFNNLGLDLDLGSMKIVQGAYLLLYGILTRFGM